MYGLAAALPQTWQRNMRYTRRPGIDAFRRRGLRGVSFQTSRGGVTLQPGDTWTVSITGAPPNSSVAVFGNVMAGAQMGTPSAAAATPMGSTDANGNFSLSGTISAAEMGLWAETWYVGGNVAGAFSFTVVQTAPAPASSPGGGGSSSAGSTGSSSGGSTSSPASQGTGGGTASSSFDLSSIPGWMWLAGGGVIVLLVVAGGRH